MYINEKKAQTKENEKIFNINEYCAINNVYLLKTFAIENYCGYELSCNVCKKEWKTDVFKLLKNKYACPLCSQRLKNKKYDTNNDSFLNEDDISFYLLGVWYSDGHISYKNINTKQCGLTSIDKEWIEKIRDIISPGRPVTKEVNRNTYKLYINSEKFYDWLEKWGCVQNKTFKLKFPENIPEKYLPDFMRGLTDGDGSVIIYEQKCENKAVGKHTKTRIKCVLFGGCEEFFNGIILNLAKIGLNFKLAKVSLKDGRIICGVPVKKTGAFCFRLNSAEFKAAKILKWMYYDGMRIFLKRKADKSKLAIKAIENHMKTFPGRYKGKTL